MLEEAGADMLELNMSCPNLGLMAKQMGVDEEPELGATLGKDPALAGQVCKAVVDAVKIPVMPKMTPEANTMMVARVGAEDRSGRGLGHQLPAVAAAARHQQRRHAVLPVDGNQSFAGLCGPWIRPLAYRHIAQMRTICPDLPLAGGGGLMNWRHSVEMIMYGATVLTYCSLLYLKGYKAFAKIEPGMHKFMDENGYETWPTCAASRSSTSSPRARSTTSRCCPRSTSRSATAAACAPPPATASASRSATSKAVLVKPKECYSCAVCYFLCAREAITMVEAPIEKTRAGVAYRPE